LGFLGKRGKKKKWKNRSGKAKFSVEILVGKKKIVKQQSLTLKRKN